MVFSLLPSNPSKTSAGCKVDEGRYLGILLAKLPSF